MQGLPLEILLVEDNDAHAELVMRSFEDHRVANRLNRVSDGEAALDYLRRGGKYADPVTSPTPHLILLDLRLPKIDGLELLEQIRGDGRIGPIPMPPEEICFEITEAAVVANIEGATHFVNTLKRLGCKFALDDFGSGLSSFVYLKHLAVDFLKIDGQFVKDIDRDPMDFSMVTAINQVAHVMGKKTIAEFVERPSVFKMLSEIRVDYAQGYWIGWPQPLESMASTQSAS